MSDDVVVVTIAHGRHDHLRRQQHSLLAGTVTPDRHVVVAMGDPVLERWEPPSGLATTVLPVDVAGPLPLARARNLGARRAVELGAQTVVFLDVDCLAGPDLVAAYDGVVGAHPGTIWSGPVTYLGPGAAEDALARPHLHDDPHPARPAPWPGEVVHGADPDLFWSLSFALHRDAWRRTGGFCEDYTGYGAEDTDFGRVAVASGLSLGWVGSARAYHQHHAVEDPPVRHLHDIVRNATVFHRRWGTWPMLGWLEEFARLGLVERTGQGRGESWQVVAGGRPAGAA